MTIVTMKVMTTLMDIAAPADRGAIGETIIMIEKYV